MFGDVANWCFEHLGGLRFEAGNLTISPKIPKDLDFFECEYIIPNKGKISVKWHKNSSGKVEYDIKADSNVKYNFVENN